MYAFCGFLLESDISFQELTKAAGDEPDIRIRLGPARRIAERPSFHEWRLPDGELFLGFAREGDAYVLSFPGLAEYRVSGRGRTIACAPAPGAPASTVRTLLLDQVLPLVLSLRSGLVLHASGVEIDGGAVAFLGASGRGKSTLAAFLCREGAALVTDDALLLREEGNRVIAVPNCPAVRLWKDGSRDSKQRLPARGCGGPRPLHKAYVLEEGGAVAITPLAAREGCVQLLLHAFMLDVEAREGQERWLDAAARVAERVAVARLSVPRGLERLPEVREAVLADAEAPCPR